MLYRTCGYHALVPKAFKVLVYYDGTSDPLFRGGFADVWKGEFFGRAVAVKVIRTDSKSGLKKFIEVSWWLSPSLFIISRRCSVEVLQGGCVVEIPPASECLTPDRGVDFGDPIRDGIEVDDKRMYQ